MKYKNISLENWNQFKKYLRYFLKHVSILGKKSQCLSNMNKEDTS